MKKSKALINSNFDRSNDQRRIQCDNGNGNWKESAHEKVKPIKAFQARRIQLQTCSLRNSLEGHFQSISEILRDSQSISLKVDQSGVERLRRVVLSIFSEYFLRVFCFVFPFCLATHGLTSQKGLCTCSMDVTQTAAVASWASTTHSRNNWRG